MGGLRSYRLKDIVFEFVIREEIFIGSGFKFGNFFIRPYKAGSFCLRKVGGILPRTGHPGDTCRLGQTKVATVLKRRFSFFSAFGGDQDHTVGSP